MSHSTKPHNSHSHGSEKSYFIGLVLSIVLTLIAFGAAMVADELSVALAFIIILTAVAQIMVQVVFFLHMDGDRSQAWNSLTGIYTVIILLVIILGTMWIFYHLHMNTNMIGH